MKKLLFVFNPQSGKAQMKTYLLDVIQVFVRAGYEVTVHPTQCRQDAQRLIAERGGDFDLVVCSGGDGTLNEAVQGMMELSVPRCLGYIPSGSTNDFGASLELSKDIVQAARVAAEGFPFPCDIGSFNSRYFTYIAAFGAFTDVAYETSQQTKNILGRLAYVLEGMRRLSSIAAVPLTVEHDGQILQREYVFGMVSNSMSIGGMKGLVGSDIMLDDGLFEAAFIRRPSNAAELHETLNALLRQDYIHAPCVDFFRSGKVTVRSENGISWTLDGEFGGTVKEAVIENHQQAIIFRRAESVVKTPPLLTGGQSDSTEGP